MKIKETIRKQKKRLFALCMIGVFILALFWGQQEAKANWWDPVYVYSQAGNNAIFRVVDTEPRVYFASYGKAASGGTKYLTVGWKIYLSNGASYVFSCGGSKVHNLPSKNVDGYIYSAYFITLKDIRDSIGAAHFNNPNYTIWMDAYNTVIENGTTKGGVSDGGATWGEVYSTYDGIANARGWSATTKENMHTMIKSPLRSISLISSLIRFTIFLSSLCHSVYCSHAVGVNTIFIYSKASSSAMVFVINPPASASAIDLSIIVR